MISDEVARNGLAAIGIAAVMVMEDALDQIVVVSSAAGHRSTADTGIVRLLKRLAAVLGVGRGRRSVCLERRSSAINLSRARD